MKTKEEIKDKAKNKNEDIKKAPAKKDHSGPILIGWIFSVLFVVAYIKHINEWDPNGIRMFFEIIPTFLIAVCCNVAGFEKDSSKYEKISGTIGFAPP